MSDLSPVHNNENPPLRWDHICCAFLLSVMALIAFVNVLSRYLFHYSLAFTEEITVHCFVLLMVLGSGLAFERGSQLGMVSLYNRFPMKGKRVVIVVGSALSALLYLVVDILIICTIYMKVTLFKDTSPALGIPVWIYYAVVIPASGVVFKGIYRGMMRALTPLPLHKGRGSG